MNFQRNQNIPLETLFSMLLEEDYFLYLFHEKKIVFISSPHVDIMRRKSTGHKDYLGT